MLSLHAQQFYPTIEIALDKNSQGAKEDLQLQRAQVDDQKKTKGLHNTD